MVWFGVLCGVERVKRFVKSQPKNDEQNVDAAPPLEKFLRTPMSMFHFLVTQIDFIERVINFYSSAIVF